MAARMQARSARLGKVIRYFLPDSVEPGFYFGSIIFTFRSGQAGVNVLAQRGRSLTAHIHGGKESVEMVPVPR